MLLGKFAMGAQQCTGPSVRQRPVVFIHSSLLRAELELMKIVI